MSVTTDMCKNNFDLKTYETLKTLRFAIFCSSRVLEVIDSEVGWSEGHVTDVTDNLWTLTFEKMTSKFFDQCCTTTQCVQLMYKHLTKFLRKVSNLSE